LRLTILHRIVEVDYDPASNYSAGRIPSAVMFDWKRDMNDQVARDILSREQLGELYRPRRVTPEEEVIAYCRIGERSSFSWFVLKYLLGYQNVKSYDGSWTEWGNSVRFPIRK